MKFKWLPMLAVGALIFMAFKPVAVKKRKTIPKAYLNPRGKSFKEVPVFSDANNSPI